MEIYTYFPEMLLFRDFCDFARQFPHTLPHKFASVIEGYYQFLGPRHFRVISRLTKSDLPFFGNAMTMARVVKAEIYPIFGKPVEISDPGVAEKLSPELLAKWGNELTRIQHLFTWYEFNQVMNYVADAADRIHSLLTEFVVEPPERTHLKDILPYSNISEKCTTYMSRSTLTDLTPISRITKDIKKATLKVPELSFSRLSNLNKTVTYTE